MDRIGRYCIFLMLLVSSLVGGDVAQSKEQSISCIFVSQTADTIPSIVFDTIVREHSSCNADGFLEPDIAGIQKGVQKIAAIQSVDVEQASDGTIVLIYRLRTPVASIRSKGWMFVENNLIHKSETELFCDREGVVFPSDCIYRPKNIPEIVLPETAALFTEPHSLACQELQEYLNMLEISLHFFSLEDGCHVDIKRLDFSKSTKQWPYFQREILLDLTVYAYQNNRFERFLFRFHPDTMAHGMKEGRSVMRYLRSHVRKDQDIGEFHVDMRYHGFCLYESVGTE